MIYSDSATCRFCSAPIDRYAAEAAADNQKKVLWGTENRRFRLRQNQAGPANCATALAAREFHSNPYCHRTDRVVTDRG